MMSKARESALYDPGHAPVSIYDSVADTLKILLIVVAMKAVLDWIYIEYVSSNFQGDFGYDFLGMGQAHRDIPKIAIFLRCSLTISLRLHPRTSGIILALQYSVVAMPLLTLYASGQVGTSSTYLVTVSILLLTAATR